MKQIISELTFKTNGEGFLNITESINNWISSEKLMKGILVISTLHTSCSLTINENADPDVLKDLSAFMKDLVPEDGFPLKKNPDQRYNYLHSSEGKDDMPAHIKTMLTCNNLSLSVNQGKLVLGVWQGVYLWEHRYLRNLRRLHMHAIGELF
tara:strand:- start:9887 stop:10342 length:456 start_codon:yes stop_codon:yes gene_type:complete